MTEKFDVLYIGSGQATWNGAVPVANSGLTVAVVEEDLFGGVCSNRGCNAKIILDKPIEIARTVEALQGRGFDETLTINWRDLMAHKHELIDAQSEHNEHRLTSAGITVIKGHAKFVDAHTITVNDTQYQADKIVIATGLRPHVLDVPGNELFHDSTDFLALADMPEHVTILGGGFIALEFATIANAVGAKVDVITYNNRYLKAFHQPYVTRVVADLKRRGVRFLPNITLTNVAENRFREIELTGEHNFALTTDYVIDATGRIPNHDTLDLEKVGVTTTRTGIPVDEHLQTNIPGIYAAGDIIDKIQPKITPTAAFESRYLAALFTNQTTEPINYPAISTVVFTSPRIAQVGVTVAEAQQQPDVYTIEEVDYLSDWFRQVSNETESYLTLIFNQEHVLVGATEMSNEATNSINTFVPYIEMGLTRQQLQRFVYLFPSIEYTGQRRL
ncbi:MAG: NAD(P)/FAD-dependent oxidoreductase [Lactobacillaceae bacterium]|jgi:glutathione reductase (NADPH)|nr:NAD(P)/FAD-dependent oxidoreductase [Lactobacillaceae bacterium]